MRVLQLIDSLNPGGAERMAVTLANSLAEKGHSSFLCITREEGLLKQSVNKSVNYLYLNKKSTFDLFALRKLLIFIKLQEIDVVHAHSTSIYLATLIKRLRKDIVLVWHDHYGDAEHLTKRKFKMLKWCSRSFNAIISVNGILKDWALRNLNCEKVYYLQNYVSDEAHILPEVFLKGNREYRIVCLANIRRQKDHITLLSAFKKIRNKYPESTLHLIGNKKGDAYESSLHDYIAVNNIEGVFLYGAQLGVNVLLKSATVGVLSSDSEGLPLALLEYGLAGLPIVCTNVGQCREVLNDFGIVVPPRNTEALANGVLEYFENRDYSLIQAKNFRNHVIKEYSVSKVIPILLSIYEND